MTFYQYPDYMYHHGVKGMKWGVRRAERKQARQQTRKIKRDIRTYDKGVKEFNKIARSAQRRGVKPGTVITSRTGTKVGITKTGAQWISGNKKLQQMPVEDLMDAMYYKKFKQLPI